MRDDSSYLVPPGLGARLAPIDAPLDDPTPLRHAAVLAAILPMIDPREGERILLIERSGELRSHAGQLALPGGKPEPGDRDLVETALREAEEEVALARDRVSVLGRLSPVPTPSGFLIVPYVGRVRGPWEPTVVPGEVVATLTPSLRQLADPRTYTHQGSVEWMGRSYDLHEFAIYTPRLWGATARIVYDLLQRLDLDPRASS
ncbi:MAG: CoA pyrophosphatase [Nannocystaceae bacterium]